VQILEGRTVLTVLKENIFRMYEAGNLYRPLMEIEVQFRHYTCVIVHDKIVFLFSRENIQTRVDLYSLMICKPKMTSEEILNIENDYESQKVCICEDLECGQRREMRVFDYKKWLDFNPSSPLEINSWLFDKQILVLYN
jgi:hypothetical protein